MRFTVALLAAIACFGSVSAKTLWHELDDYSFEDFVDEYSKSYKPAEYLERKQIFEARLDEIRSHNQDATQTYKKGVNHMTDRTDEEFSKLLGYKKYDAYTSKTRSSKTTSKHSVSVDAAPTSIDWRDNAKVTAVKDQGQCGSCWSFGTTETIESHYAIKTGRLAVLSPQHILDCTPNPNKCGGTGGCGGGTPELAYAKLMEQGGQASEWTYPYRSYFGNNFNTCSFNATQTTPVAQISSFVALPSNEYAPVLNAVGTAGPVVVAVDASAWSSYESGVFSGCNATNVDIDHAVVVVGYGSDAQLGDYWLVRNSWSPSWGEQGYIRLTRSADTECGIDYSPADGTGCTGGPSQVKVCGPCGLFYDVSYPIISNTN